MQKYELRQIGIVISEMKDLSEMPSEGAPASILIYPEYEKALMDIKNNSHYYVLGWLDKSDREILQVSPRKKRDLPPRGVFSLRAPVRPNPVSLTIARLEAFEQRMNGTLLSFDRLDLIDATPVIDLKPYTVGWDLVMSARNLGEADLYRRMSKEELIIDMAGQASRYHGKLCIGAMIGVRAAYLAFKLLDTDLRRKDLEIMANVRPCTCDALIAVTSANSRRLVHGDPLGEITFRTPELTLILHLTSEKIVSIEAISHMSDEEIFSWELQKRQAADDKA